MDDLDRRILALEARTYRSVGAKERAIRRLGLTPTRYLVRVRALAWDPDAIRAAPAVTRRLREQMRERP